MSSKKIHRSSISASHPHAEKASPSDASPAEVAARASALVDAVSQFTDAVRLESALTPSERQALPYPRKGGERFYPTLIALAKKYDLQMPAYPLAAIEAELQQAGLLAPLEHSVAELVTRLSDTQRRRQAEAWSTATMTYSMLVRLARRDGDVAEAIAPLREFFARPAKVKSTKSAAAAPAAAAQAAKP